MSVPFVGRHAELDRIRALARTVSVDRRPSALVFVGEPGIGKSRLLAEARAAIGFRHQLVVVGYEPERAVPLASAAELLRTVMRADPGGRLSELLGDPAHGGLEPIRVFEATHRAVERLQPLLIVIDDLQWVDDLSVALCHYLLRAAVAESRAVGLLAMSRQSPVAGSFVDSLRHVFPDSGQAAVEELGPLRRSDGIELARAISNELPAGRAAELWSSAAGSPFWLSMLAGSRADDEVADLIHRRLRNAPPDAMELGGVLAVAGKPAPIDTITRAAGLPETRVDAALNNLISAGLAARSGSDVALVHDLVRHAIDGRLAPETRRRLHRAWAETLEDLAPGDLGALRSALEHRRAAGMPAVHLALELATSSKRRWLGTDGLALIGAIADEGESTDPAVPKLRSATAALASELGEDRVAFERWTDVADRLPVGAARERALIGVARAAYELNLEEESRAAIGRARAEATTTANRIALDALEAEVVIWLQGRPTEGWPLARRAAIAAQHVARQAGGVDPLPADDRRALIDSLRIAFHAAVQDDQWRELGDIAAAYLEAATEFDGPAEIRALLSIGSAASIRGEYRQALDARRRAWEESRRRIYPTLAVEAGFPYANILIFTGEINAAQQVIRETLDLVERIGVRGRLLARNHFVAQEVAFHAGRRPAAVAELVQAIETVIPHYAVSAHQLLAHWVALLDGTAAADDVVQRIEAGRASAAAAGCPRCALEFELWSARALAWVGRHADARRAVEAWDAARPDPNPDDSVIRRWVEGLLTPDDASAAEGFLSDALAMADRSGRATEAIGLRLELGLLLAGTDRPRATEWFSAAAAAGRDAGSVALQGLAERQLRTLGVRTWRRRSMHAESEIDRRAGQNALSTRELEVARLVASGASNPEIAAQLFLSRKTVERHVSNALAKVGARNRTELAHRLTEIDPAG